MTGRRSASCPRRRAAAALLAGAAALALGCTAVPAPQPPPVRSDVVGHLAAAPAALQDTFADLARRHDLGYLELVAANPGTDPWVPEPGQPLVLPGAHLLPRAPREGLVINIAEQRLYHFRPDGSVVTHPIGIGRDGAGTPLGVTKVVAKRERPTWTPGPSARHEDPTLPVVVPAGPDNPLGDHALYLGWNAYLVHGTNTPDGVGRRVSRGCIRLYPEDIASLYATVSVGTRVHVLEEPVKLGWYGDALLLEAHPSLRQASALDAGDDLVPEEEPGLRERIVRAAGDAAPRVDWERVAEAVRERRGVPVVIAAAPDAEVPAQVAYVPVATTPSVAAAGQPSLWRRAPDALAETVGSVGRLLGLAE